MIAAVKNEPISTDFFQPDAQTVARALIAATLLVNGVGGCIIETEAYDATDSASHSYGGQTRRHAVMLDDRGMPMYNRCPGCYWCVNIVCGARGSTVPFYIDADAETWESGMSSQRVKRDSMRNLLTRALSIGPKIIYYLVGRSKHRGVILLSYIIAAPLTALSFVRLFFELNLDIAAWVTVPTLNDLYQEAATFLVQPLIWTGIHVSDLWKTIIALSCIGSSVFINADFLERWLAARFISGRLEDPGFFTQDWSKPPPEPQPIRNSLFWRVAKPIIAIITGYLLLGIIPLLPMIAFGVISFCHSITYLCAWASMLLIFGMQEFLAPFERWGEDDYWGTRVFLFAYRLRDRLDVFLDRFSGEKLRYVSLRASDRWWMVLRRTAHHGAHIISLAIWILCLIAAIRYLTS